MMFTSEDIQAIQTAEDDFSSVSAVNQEEISLLKNKQDAVLHELESLKSMMASVKKAEESEANISTGHPSSILHQVENRRCACDSAPKLDLIQFSIEKIQNEWSKMNQEINVLSLRSNKIEQYGRLYNLILDGIVVPKHLKGLGFSNHIVQLLNSILARHLKFYITLSDIDISHPLYFKKSNGKHVVIIRFTRRDVRNAIFDARNILSNHGIDVRENLTKENRELFHWAKGLLYPYYPVDTELCSIFAIVNGTKTFIRERRDVYKIIESLGLNDDAVPYSPSITVVRKSSKKLFSKAVSSPRSNIPCENGMWPSIAKVFSLKEQQNSNSTSANVSVFLPGMDHFKNSHNVYHTPKDILHSNSSFSAHKVPSTHHSRNFTNSSYRSLY